MVRYSGLHVPVACVDFLQTALSAAAAIDKTLDHLDVAEFSHATLPDSERIWERLSTIQIIMPGGRTVQSLKSLYGSCQAPKLWYQQLSKQVDGTQIKRFKVSYCLSICQRPDPASVVVYVHGLLVIGSDTAGAQLKRKAGTSLSATDHGQCPHIPVIRVEQPDKWYNSFTGELCSNDHRPASCCQL